MIEIRRIVFENDEMSQLLTKEQVEKCLFNLNDIFGKRISYILPTDRDYLYQYELFKLYFLSSALNDLMGCSGFSDHLNEYSNSFEATYFVTIIADILVSHGLDVVLEPRIEEHQKRPDIYANQAGNGIYFECKNPIDPDLIFEQQAIFDCISELMSSEYSLACFYEFELTEDKLLNLKEKFRKSLEDDPYIYENRVIVEDDDLRLKVIVSGIPDNIENESKIIISGLPVFNHFGFCYVNGINEYGKNIVFYKKASPNIVWNQIKKSRNKVPNSVPCVTVINISGPRFDLDYYLESSSSLFDIKKDESISGVILCQYQFNEKGNLIICQKFVSNPYALCKVNWLDGIFSKTFTKQIIHKQLLDTNCKDRSLIT